MPKYVYTTAACPVCGVEKKSNGLHKHIKAHGPQAWAEYEASKAAAVTWVQHDDEFQCRECSFVGSKNAVVAHAWRAHTVEGQQHLGTAPGSRYNEGRKAWNHGRTKDTDERVAKFGATLAARIAAGEVIPSFTGKTHSLELRQKLSLARSVKNHGGRCRWYLVDGQMVQGTWERNVGLMLSSLGIAWTKLRTHRDVLVYVMDGKHRTYTPDFYLAEQQLYLEIKGFWWGNDRRKMQLVREQHPDKRIVVVEKDAYERLMQGELVW